MVPVLFIVCVLSSASDAALRVFGGRDVDPQEYPYVVRLEIKTNIKIHNIFAHICTASVLTPIWTLSAGHCMDFKDTISYMQALLPSATIKYVIRYGSTTEPRSSSESFSDIIASVRHPAYKAMSSAHVNNDVGLLKTMPVNLSRYGKLSAVEYSSLAGQEAVAMGYGLMQDGEKVADTLTLGKTLQALDVLIKSCPKDLTGTFTPILCLSRKCHQSVASLCPGDSGGPLVHFSGVVGINHMAAHPDCTLGNAKAGVSSNLVAIITPIGPYIEWIANQIRGNEVKKTDDYSKPHPIK